MSACCLSQISELMGLVSRQLSRTGRGAAAAVPAMLAQLWNLSVSCGKRQECSETDCYREALK